MPNKVWLVEGLLLVSVAGLAGCDDTTGGPATVFESSGCKKESTSQQKLARIRALHVIQAETGLEGLRCVAWQRTSDAEVKIDLYNFDAACGATWTGDGDLGANGRLELHVANPGCMIAACGSCLYDWSFDVQVALPSDQEVPLVVAVDTCPGQQEIRYRQAAIGPEPSGIRCTLADYGAMSWQASALGTCGQAGMPCIGALLCGSGSFTSTGTCSDGLVCDSSAAVNEPVCLVPCTTVADCPRADVYTCQAGLCRPAG